MRIVLGSGKLIQKQFLFVDLAGSERTKKSGVSGQRHAEATQINSSLTVLGRVIRGLGTSGSSSSRGSSHVPYRDSTLTMLLRSSFESGSKAGSFTSVVINVASEPEHHEETECSLQFGARMASVRNVAAKVVGTDVGRERARISAAAEVLRPKLREMEAAGVGGGIVRGAPTVEREMLEANMKKLRNARRRCNRLQVEITEAASVSRGSGSSKREELEGALFDMQNLSDIVARQKTIKRLWREPTPSYLAAEAELKSLTDQLRRLA